MSKSNVCINTVTSELFKIRRNRVLINMATKKNWENFYYKQF